MPRSAPRRIVIIGFAGMQSLDVVGPFDVFSGADQALGITSGSRGYSTSLVSASGGLVHCESGLGLATEPLPANGHGVHRCVPGRAGRPSRRPTGAAAMSLRHFGRVFADEWARHPGGTWSGRASA